MSLLFSFGIVAGLGWGLFLSTWIRDFRSRRRQQRLRLVWSQPSGAWVHRKDQPSARFRVVRSAKTAEAEYVHLEGADGRRVVLSGRRFESEFEDSPVSP